MCPIIPLVVEFFSCLVSQKSSQGSLLDPQLWNTLYDQMKVLDRIQLRYHFYHWEQKTIFIYRRCSVSIVDNRLETAKCAEIDGMVYGKTCSHWKRQMVRD